MKPSTFKSLFAMVFTIGIISALVGLAIYGLVAVILYKIATNM